MLQRTKLMRRLKDLPNQERLLRHVATRESAALCYTMMYYNILIYSNIPSSLQREPRTLLWEVQAASFASWYRLCCASRCLFWSPRPTWNNRHTASQDLGASSLLWKLPEAWSVQGRVTIWSSEAFNVIPIRDPQESLGTPMFQGLWCQIQMTAGCILWPIP